jgi:hypothetical protein
MKNKDAVKKFDNLKLLIEKKRDEASHGLRKSGDPDAVIYYTGYEDAAGTVFNAFNNIFMHNLKTKDGKIYANDYITGILDFYKDLHDEINTLFNSEKIKGD